MAVTEQQVVRHANGHPVRRWILEYMAGADLALNQGEICTAIAADPDFVGLNLDSVPYHVDLLEHYGLLEPAELQRGGLVLSQQGREMGAIA